MKVWNISVDILFRLTRWATIGLFALLFIVVMMQIIWRYVLALPLPWSDEASRYLLAWVALLAIALAFRHGEHFRLDFIYSRLRGQAKVFCWFLFNLLSLLLLAIIFYYGIPYAIGGQATNSPGLTSFFDNITVSMLPAYLSVPVASSLMIINQIDYMLKHLPVSLNSSGDERKHK
jgi:TRAP-type C4-dicarboxylate transport system permease small subunit